MMPDVSDCVRVAAAAVAAVTFVGMVYIGSRVGRPRFWGCLSVSLAAVAITGGNLTRLGQVITPWTLFGVGAMCAGLKYVAAVVADPDWKRKD